MFSLSSDVCPGLGKIQEETGELGVVLGKLVATQGDWEYPWPDENGQHRDLRREAEDECADVLAAVTFFIEHNHLNQHAINERLRDKRQKYAEWRLAGEG